MGAGRGAPYGATASRGEPGDAARLESLAGLHDPPAGPSGAADPLGPPGPPASLITVPCRIL